MPTLDVQVDHDNDDCRVYWTGAVWTLLLTANHDQVGYQDAARCKSGAGMRFLNITIPKGSKINSAYVTVKASVSRDLTTVNTKVRGEDVDDAARFTTVANYNGRARTSAEVNWDNIPAWNTDTEYDSPEIKTVIQEIIDRAGWASANDIVIFWDDHDDRSTHTDNTRRQCYSHDHVAANAPKLHIEYTEPAAGGARSHGYIMG